MLQQDWGGKETSPLMDIVQSLPAMGEQFQINHSTAMGDDDDGEGADHIFLATKKCNFKVEKIGIPCNKRS